MQEDMSPEQAPRPADETVITATAAGSYILISIFVTMLAMMYGPCAPTIPEDVEAEDCAGIYSVYLDGELVKEGISKLYTKTSRRAEWAGGRIESLTRGGISYLCNETPRIPNEAP